MIGYLRGTPQRITTQPLILLVGDVGYNVYVPSSYTTKLTVKSPVALHIYTHVKEDVLDLYGFFTSEELHVFTLLISVSGVGPKIALNVLDSGVSMIHTAISTKDVSFFTAIPRLGKKNAQKIIIDLGSKIGASSDIDLSEDVPGDTNDVVDALVSMGFSRKEIMAAFKYIEDSDTTIQAKIKRILKHIKR